MSTAPNSPADEPEDEALDALAARMRTCLADDAEQLARGGPPQLEDYVELREVQRGGQGVVYTARQLSTGRRVAIKQLETRGAHAERHTQRFEHEVEVASRLVHPNIVPVFDRGTTAHGTLYFVMEFIDGTPLDVYAENNDLDLRQRLALFDRLCAALAYAHRCGVVHRDLKPENVLVDDTGEPRVLDFGLAKSLDEPADSGVTRAGEFLGTLAHAAPEQLSGDLAAVDERTDVHGLGILLYRLLARCHPFPTDGSLQELVRTLSEEDPPPPSRHAALVDADLDALCLSCLAKDPAARYASVDALREDLAAWRDGLPLHARAHHRGYVLRRTLRRHRALVAAVLFVMIGLGASSLIAWSALGEARQEARRAEHLSDFLVDALVAAEPGLHPRDITLAQWIERARHDVGTRFRAEPISEAAVRDAVGHVLRATGSFVEAEAEFTSSLELLAQAGLAGGRQAVATRLHLAQSLFERGDWDAAQSQLEELGGELDTLAVADRVELAARRAQLLGMLRLAQDRPLEALAVLEAAAQGARDAGRDDLRAVVLPALADALRETGAYDAALAMSAEAETLRAALLGDTHPFVQRLRHNHALLLAELGRYDEALEALRAVVAQLEADLAAEHPATLRAKVNLAGTLDDAGEEEAARALLAELVDSALPRLGPQHRVTLDAQHALGALLRRADELPAAITQLSAALEGRRQMLGTASEETLRTQVELALSVGRAGRLEEAEELLRSATDQARTALGGLSHTTLDAQHSLAVLLLDTGRAEDAEELWADMQPRADAAFVPPDSRPAVYRLQRGLALARLGRFDEAVLVLEAAHARFEAGGEAHAANRQATRGLLVQIHGARGDEEAAQRWNSAP